MCSVRGYVSLIPLQIKRKKYIEREREGEKMATVFFIFSSFAMLGTQTHALLHTPMSLTS